MTHTRRRDRLGVHSIGAFHLAVPSLAEARRFYTAFGLDVQEAQGGLVLRTHGDPHAWGHLHAGPHKKFERLVFHCFEDELGAFARRFAGLGVSTEAPPPGSEGDGLWLRSPDGVLLQVRPGPKTTPDQPTFRPAAAPVPGVPCAPYRSAAAPVRPQRLSHVALLTADLQAQIDFYEAVLGLRLSDRAGDGVAFLHGPHGSDHHLLALAASTGPGLHHLSWDVPGIEEVGLGAMALAEAGYTQGWGVGRHVLGSNYFYYAQDPWGSFCEYSAAIDYIPAAADWQAKDHPPHDAFYLWGPPVPPAMLANSEQGLWS